MYDSHDVRKWRLCDSRGLPDPWVTRPAKTGVKKLGSEEDAFTFTARGLACPGLRAGVQAKGKGEMEMYFVAVRKPPMEPFPT